MNVLRGLGTAFCSFLLFLAISVLSLAFLLNSTVLNPKFMNEQINKLDTSALTRDIVDDELKEQLPQGSDLLLDISINTIKKEDALIKSQVTTVINDAYAYFLGEKDTLQLSVSLKAIKQDLKNTVWDTAVEYLRTKTANMSEAQFKSYALSIIDQIPLETLPAEIKALPQSTRNEVIILYIKDMVGRATFEGSSFGLSAQAKSEVKNTVQQYFNDYIDEIPDSWALDESAIGRENMKSLADAKTYIGYFKLGYIWLIVLIAVLAGLIFLINWSDLKTSTRSLGIDLLIFGALDLAGVLVMKSLSLMTSIPGYNDVPVSLQNWIQGVVSDVTGIIMKFSIAVIIIGALLLTVSFFVRGREKAAG
jgi:hypothetical protein